MGCGVGGVLTGSRITGAGAMAAPKIAPFVGGTPDSKPIHFEEAVVDLSSSSSTAGDPSPSAAASLTTFSTTVASASGDAGGATPINSSSLAIRYPSSFKLPMI